jgi:hypothetical protein
MKVRCLLPVLILLFASASRAHAEEVVEVCRTGDIFSYVEAISADPNDGSCVLANGDGTVVRVRNDCTAEWAYETPFVPECVSVNTRDRSCWVASDDSVCHVAADGTELLVVDRFRWPVSVSANPTDGSVWVADPDRFEVLHLAEDGAELWWGDRFEWPHHVAVNPADGSCWVGDTARWGHEEAEDLPGEIVHLAEDGTELLRMEWFAHLPRISVVPADGSIWVTVPGGELIAHLAEDGTELWRGTLDGPTAPHANQADGSCWVGEYASGEIVHLAADGTELWRGAGLRPRAVDSVDGSCWAAAAPDSTEVVHLMIPGWRPPIFYDVPPHNWAFEEVEACCRAGIVGGYPDGLYHPTLSVSRAQMAVFISRAVAGGDENIPAGPAEPTFEDVPNDHWAYRHVEYCFANDVVRGFSPLIYGPDEAVSRAAMAVFISRAVAGGDENVPAGPAEPTFEDVPTDHWAYKHIEYAVSEDIVQGYDPFSYAPAVTVSRDQMAVFICRAFDLPM